MKSKSDDITMSVGPDNVAEDFAVGVSGVDLPPTRSELLCFLQQRCAVLAFDDLVKITGDFYSMKEVLAARTLIAQFLPDRRLPMHKGSDREKASKTITDMLRLMLHPEEAGSLPCFYVVDVSRLPPVSVEHVDVSAVLQELVALRREHRAEMNAVAELRGEIEDLKSVVRRSAAVSQMRTTAGLSMELDESEFPPLSAAARPSTGTYLSATTAGAVASPRERVETTGATLPSAAVKKPARKPVVGASKINVHVKAIPTKRCVDIFVSRLHPETTDNELVDSVNSVKGELLVHEVHCTKLKSKYDFYSSFYVAVHVDSNDFKAAIDLLMAPEAWPSGVFVKRFFKNRNGPE